MNYSAYTETISSRLALQSPPVALSFVESPPAGISAPDSEVPAGCAFWRKAETGVFYAPAEAQAALFAGLGTAERRWIILSEGDHAAHLERVDAWVDAVLDFAAAGAR